MNKIKGAFLLNAAITILGAGVLASILEKEALLFCVSVIAFGIFSSLGFYFHKKYLKQQK